MSNKKFKSAKKSKIILEKKEPEYISCSFRYLTTNKKYLISDHSKFKKNNKEKLKCYEELFYKLKEMQSMPWSEFMLMPKNIGQETINYSQMNIEPNNLTITKDSKVHSIRFCNQNYRIIGYKDEKLPILHIIGFDLDYSAYDHG